MKKLLSTAALCAVLVPVSVSAVDVKIKGQINKSIMFSDDGRNGDFTFVDNNLSKSNSLFRVKRFWTMA